MEWRACLTELLASLTFYAAWTFLVSVDIHAKLQQLKAFIQILILMHLTDFFVFMLAYQPPLEGTLYTLKLFFFWIIFLDTMNNGFQI